jgi:hypothetical protein
LLSPVKANWNFQKKPFSVRKDSYFCPKYECLIKNWIQLHETFKFSIYSRQHNRSHQFKLDLLTKCIFATALVRISFTTTLTTRLEILSFKKVFLFQFLSNLDIPYHFCFSRCLRRCLRRGASLIHLLWQAFLKIHMKTIYSEISNH